MTWKDTAPEEYDSDDRRKKPQNDFDHYYEDMPVDANKLVEDRLEIVSETFCDRDVTIFYQVFAGDKLDVYACLFDGVESYLEVSRRKKGFDPDLVTIMKDIFPEIVGEFCFCGPFKDCIAIIFASRQDATPFEKYLEKYPKKTVLFLENALDVFNYFLKNDLIPPDLWLDYQTLHVCENGFLSRTYDFLQTTKNRVVDFFRRSGDDDSPTFSFKFEDGRKLLFQIIAFDGMSYRRIGDEYLIIVKLAELASVVEILLIDLPTSRIPFFSKYQKYRIKKVSDQIKKLAEFQSFKIAERAENKKKRLDKKN